MPDQKYHDLHTEDPEVHDDSSTEVDEEKLLWKEDYQSTDASPRRARLRRAWTLFNSIRWIIDTGLLVTIAILLLQRRDMRPVPRFENTGDITGFAPQFSQKLVRFHFNASYVPLNASEFFTPKVKQAWLDLVPTGLGFLHVDHPEKYDNLPTPLKEYKQSTVFTTSMTHQLHCLYSMLEHWYGSRTDRIFRHEEWHVQHCFEYLRQSIMCAGDIALEGAETTFPVGHRGGSDGWDATHVCRDYSQVYRYLEDNRQNDITWI